MNIDIKYRHNKCPSREISWWFI